MDKLFPRIVAFLLIPCLLTEPVVAAGLISQSCGLRHVVFADPFPVRDSRSAFLFNNEAVSPPFIGGRTPFAPTRAAELSRRASGLVEPAEFPLRHPYRFFADDWQKIKVNLLKAEKDVDKSKKRFYRYFRVHGYAGWDPLNGTQWFSSDWVFIGLFGPAGIEAAWQAAEKATGKTRDRLLHEMGDHLSKVAHVNGNPEHVEGFREALREILGIWKLANSLDVGSLRQAMDTLLGEYKLPQYAEEFLARSMSITPLSLWLEKLAQRQSSIRVNRQRIEDAAIAALAALGHALPPAAPMTDIITDTFSISREALDRAVAPKGADRQGRRSVNPDVPPPDQPSKVQRLRISPVAQRPIARGSPLPPQPNEYTEGLSLDQFEAFIQWLVANDEVVDEQKLAVVIGPHTPGFREGCIRFDVLPIESLRSRSVASITNEELRKANRLLSEAGRTPNVRTTFSFFNAYGREPAGPAHAPPKPPSSLSARVIPERADLPAQTPNGESPPNVSLRDIPTRAATRRTNAKPETSAPDRKQQNALRTRFWAAVERFDLPAVRKQLLESHAAADDVALTSAFGAFVELHPIKNAGIFKLFSERLDDLFERQIPPLATANPPLNSGIISPASAVDRALREQTTGLAPFRKIFRAKPTLQPHWEVETEPDERLTGPEKFLADTRQMSARVGLDVLVNMVKKSLIVDFAREVGLAELTSEVTLFLAGDPHAFGDGHSHVWDALWQVVQTAAAATLQAEDGLAHPPNSLPRYGPGSRTKDFPRSSS